MFDEHQFYDVEFFILDPVFIKLFKDAPDLVDELYDGLVALFFAYSLVRFLGVIEKLTEIFEQLFAGVNHLLGEDIFLTIYI